jgi:catechol 2,3-dioxygenase-like lactoylglutathione lyase family enzyme
VRPSDLFHVGIVVDDAPATRAWLTETAGFQWGDEVDVTLPVRLAGGEQDVRFRFAYSKDEPHLEVIQAVPGTPWEPVSGSGIHHLGHWSEDVAADVAAMVAAGCELEAIAGPEDAPAFAYLRTPAGPRIELVPASNKPFMAALWS